MEGNLCLQEKGVCQLLFLKEKERGVSIHKEVAYPITEKGASWMSARRVHPHIALEHLWSKVNVLIPLAILPLVYLFKNPLCR